MTKKKGAAAWLLTLSVATSAHAAPALESTRTNAAVETHDGLGSPVRAPSPRTLGSRAEEARYAAREAASAQAKNYRAGDVVVISTTALVIILLVILIIVLI